MKIRYVFLIFLGTAITLGQIQEYLDREKERNRVPFRQERIVPHIYDDILGNPVDENGNRIIERYTKQDLINRVRFYERYNSVENIPNHNHEDLDKLMEIYESEGLEYYDSYYGDIEDEDFVDDIN